MANFIRFKKVVNGRTSDVSELSGFGEVAWNFISSIYKSGWDLLFTNKYINLFKSKVMNKFTLKALKFNSALTLDSSKGKVSELKTIDLISILFYFIFLLFSPIFYWKSIKWRRQSVILSQVTWHNHRGHRLTWYREEHRRFGNKIKSYHIVMVCWPHRWSMVFRVD